MDRGVTWDDTLVVNKLHAIVLIALQHFCSNNKPWRAGSYIPKKAIANVSGGFRVFKHQQSF